MGANNKYAEMIAGANNEVSVDAVTGVTVVGGATGFDFKTAGGTILSATASGVALISPRALSPNGLNPLSIFGANCKDFFRSDIGVSDTAGVVTSWANQGSLADALAQGTAGRQPGLGVTRGRQSISFDGGDSLVSTGTAASRNFWHDGTSATIWLVYRMSVAGNTGLLDTGIQGVPTARGFTLYHTGTQHMLAVGNGATAVCNNVPGRTNFLGGIASVIIRLKTAGTPAERSFIDLGKRLEGAFSNAPSLLDAPQPLTVGSLYNNVVPFTGFILEVGSANVYATDTQLDALETYITEFHRVGGFPAD